MDRPPPPPRRQAAPPPPPGRGIPLPGLAVEAAPRPPPPPPSRRGPPPSPPARAAIVPPPSPPTGPAPPSSFLEMFGGKAAKRLQALQPHAESEDDRRRRAEKEEMAQRRLAAEQSKAEAEARAAQAEIRRKAELEHLAELVRLEEERQALDKAARAVEERLQADERAHKAKEEELLRRLGRLTAKEEVVERTVRPASEASSGDVTAGESAGSQSGEAAAKGTAHPSLRSSYEIAPSDIEQGKFLGAGAFGQVYEGTYQKHTRVALKMIGAGASPRQLEKRRADFEAEMLILGAASIPRQCSPLCMVTTFMPRGTAVQHLGKLSWNPLTIVKLLFEVALGMNHLHSRPTPILHSDLKGANVLVDENGTARVADFGLTKIRQGATAGTFFFGGTPAYIAPEVRRHTRSRASDVYSFGMMTWELFSMGEMPFEDDLLEIPAQAVAQMFGERIKSEPDYRPTRPDGCPDGAWDVMTQCWAFDQAARPAFGAVADGLKGVQMGTP